MIVVFWRLCNGSLFRLTEIWYFKNSRYSRYNSQINNPTVGLHFMYFFLLIALQNIMYSCFIPRRRFWLNRSHNRIDNSVCLYILPLQQHTQHQCFLLVTKDFKIMALPSQIALLNDIVIVQFHLNMVMTLTFTRSQRFVTHFTNDRPSQEHVFAAFVHKHDFWPWWKMKVIQSALRC